ncbi:MAG: ATP-binding cassette domain-containing protein [SAR324 cluster bacterium]|nr:ATP-binding cassette domain-containing protein [SAR324 cluster bacterium]
MIKNISFEIQRGEKVAIIGPNGIGKSTLLKIILDEISSDEGKFEWGYETKISYFAQDHHEQLDGKINSFDWLYSYAPHESIGTIRGLLGRVLLSGDEALKQVSALSGGESARLLFARIMQEKSNVLILDEPTNHMDLEGVEALGDALKKFDGTVLLVSHYRNFVEKVADHILEMTSDGIRDFSGSYNEYLEKFGEDHLGRTISVSSKKTSTEKLDAQQKKLSFEERKNLQRKISKLNKQAARFELLVEETEKKISEIESKFGIEDFFQITSRVEVNRMKAEKGRLSQQLSGHLKQWEISSQNLENAKEQFDL